MKMIKMANDGLFRLKTPKSTRTTDHSGENVKCKKNICKFLNIVS